MKKIILSIVALATISLAKADENTYYKQHYLCQTDKGDEVNIYLNYTRVNIAAVNAFGITFYGQQDQWSQDIKAKINNAGLYEPESINIKMNRLGQFYHMTVYMKNGRAPWAFKIGCIEK